MSADRHDDDHELRALLRGADPAASLPPADPTRVADLLEDAVSSTRPTPAAETAPAPARARTRRRSLVVALAAAAAAVVVASVAVPVVRSLDGAGVTSLTAQPFDPLMSSCAPVADFLGDEQLALAGTVTAVEGDRVVLDVERAYRGEPGDRVEISAPLQDETAAALVGGFPFEVGGEYLVAASGGVVAVCGASGPVTPELLAEYDRAFG